MRTPPEEDKSYFYDGAVYIMRYVPGVPKRRTTKQKAKRTAKRREQRRRAKARGVQHPPKKMESR